ncbi:MAG: beta-L-arabinofuranosidase domain-containing protein, partial [Mucilaginibacter sp.]
FEKIAELTNDTSYSTAAKFFWQRVVETRSISIGGNSVKEHFNAADNFMPMLESEQGPETCNSYNMLKLSKMLFVQNNDQKYIEFYERLLYNHILSSQHPVTGGFVYFTPIHPQHYRVYSTADQSFWCCVGTGLENHGKYGELIYTHKKNDILVNLFIPSVLNWEEQHIKIIQQNGFPEKESSTLIIEPTVPKRFTVFIRKPLWVKGGFAIKINGKQSKVTSSADGYAGITRVWRKGDRIDISLPMKNYAEYLPDHSKWVSFRHGPVVLAAPTDTANMPGLFANDGRWGQNAAGPLYPLTKSPMLVDDERGPAAALHGIAGRPMEFELSGVINKSSDKNLTLIPFYEVHDTRYMLYWPVTTKDSIAQFETEMAALDENYIKLAPRTIDQVSPGEQQPEKDHMLKYDNSEAGVAGTQHWRVSSGYFSYRMRRGRGAKLIRISYDAKTPNCDFDIYADDIKIAHIVTDGIGAAKLVNVEYPLPASVEAGKQDVIIKF